MSHATIDEDHSTLANPGPLKRAALGDQRSERRVADLRDENRVAHFGVRQEHIDDRPPCTKCDAARFFSFRRDGMEGGVHMGFIGIS